jgi:hypothetical protein
MLTLCNPLYKLPKPGLVRYYDDSSRSKFQLNLNYEDWENVFDSECDDVNVILNNFFNTYLRIFYSSFPLHKSLVKDTLNGWLTKGILFHVGTKRHIFA